MEERVWIVTWRSEVVAMSCECSDVCSGGRNKPSVFDTTSTEI